MTMRKIDIATIEAALRGETVGAKADWRLLRESPRWLRCRRVRLGSELVSCAMGRAAS